MEEVGKPGKDKGEYREEQRKTEFLTMTRISVESEESNCIRQKAS